MHIELDRNSNTSLVDQIYLSIIDQIRSNLIAEDYRFPSVRNLSKELGVSLVTVVKAYNKLEQSGHVISIQGKGTFLRKACLLKEQPKLLGPFEWQQEVQDYLPRSQFSFFHQSPQRFHFSSSKVSADLLPVTHLTRTVQTLMATNPSSLFEYGPVQGDESLRKVMGTYLNRWGIKANPSEMMITSGAQQGLDLIARTFIGPGDVVVMESPTYPGAIDAFRGRGANIITVPIDNEGMRMDLLQEVCDRHQPKLIYVTPTFNNPTGAIMGMSRRKQLLHLAEDIQCIIIEDDPWSELYFEQKPVDAIKSLDRDGHVIYLKSLSKILVPGFRIGVMLASEHLFKRLVAAKGNADLGNPLLTQRAVAKFLGSVHMDNHLTSLRQELMIRRNLVINLLTRHCPKEVTWHIPKGGLNVWITLPNRINVDTLLETARDRFVSFLPGSACFPTGKHNHHMRVSYSYVSREELDEGIRVLCNLLSEALQRDTAYLLNEPIESLKTAP